MEGDIRSLKGREKWGHVLRLHLIPEFGDFYVDQIRRSDVEAWKLKMAAKAKAGELAPTTFNGWLAILKVITSAANGEFELDRDPAAHVATLDTSTHHTYTEEQPTHSPSTRSRILGDDESSLSPVFCPWWHWGLRQGCDHPACDHFDGRGQHRMFCGRRE